MTIDWSHFTPATALAGGAMIGGAAMLLWRALGRIAGISGIAGGLLSAPKGDRGWRLAFLGGLVAAPWAARLAGAPLAPRIDATWPTLIVAGLLVGYGTRLGGGCTSGHGICGLARLSPRSLAAVVVFMATGMIVAIVTHGRAA